MKKTIITFALSLFAICGFSQKLTFITLAANVNVSTLKVDVNGVVTGLVDGWYGIQECPYVNSFTQLVNMKFKTGVQPTPSQIQQIAQDSIDAYRKRVYPDIK